MMLVYEHLIAETAPMTEINFRESVTPLLTSDQASDSADTEALSGGFPISSVLAGVGVATCVFVILVVVGCVLFRRNHYKR